MVDPALESRAAKSFDFTQFLLLCWRRRFWIAGVVILTTTIGVVISLISQPSYHSSGVIALRERDKGADASRSLAAQFGGLGGAVASQLGVGNSSLDKIEVILRGHELAENLIISKNLLPKLYPQDWDSERGAWKDPSEPPKMKLAVIHLRENVMGFSVNAKKGLVTLSARAPDSVLAKNLVEYYIEALNEKIRLDIVRNSTANRGFLENQLSSTVDPFLVEKLQSMIAYEIEQSMLASSNAVEVLDKPVVPFQRSAPKRKKIVILSFLVGGFLSVGGLFAWMLLWPRFQDLLGKLAAEGKRVS